MLVSYPAFLRAGLTPRSLDPSTDIPVTRRLPIRHLRLTFISTNMHFVSLIALLSALIQTILSHLTVKLLPLKRPKKCRSSTLPRCIGYVTQSTRSHDKRSQELYLTLQTSPRTSLNGLTDVMADHITQNNKIMVSLLEMLQTMLRKGGSSMPMHGTLFMPEIPM